MAEVIEARGVEIDGLALGAGEPYGKVGAVDRLDDAGYAVFDANPPVGAGGAGSGMNRGRPIGA